MGAASRYGFNQDARLLVRLHNAFTEPERFVPITSCLVKLRIIHYLPERRLPSEAFTNGAKFQPPGVLVLVIRNGLTTIQVGSPNLTAATIGMRPKNYELAFSAIAGNASSCRS